MNKMFFSKLIQKILLLNSVFIFIVFMQTSVLAEAVHLECKVDVKDVYYENDVNIEFFSLTIDHANSKITHINKDGKIYQTQGIFSATTIKYAFRYDIAHLLKYTEAYEIDRISLDIKGRRRIINTQFQTEEIYGINGECSIKEVPERKI